ncbi:MAG: PD-(D/E)XK nuclease family protein [Candidatus Accumulibacter sp.]|jgi:ATP-dependent helicase/nuclease subunit B|nr:PD-(D/E)XK nuclease family protein [Accumulibacter sp.]
MNPDSDYGERGAAFSGTDALNARALPPGEAFFKCLAACVFECCSRGDLPILRILTPSLPIAVELRAALARAATGPLLLPRFDTLRNWVCAAPLDGIPDPMPESERRVLLHDALRQIDRFDKMPLWGIVGEMAGLFDELTCAAVQLPGDKAGLAEQLQRAYATRASEPLAFEARVVYELWRALAAAGAPDAAAVYRLRLGELARRAARAATPQPLLVLLDAAPEEALDPAERDFLCRYGAAQPLWVFYPEPRETRATPLLATLDTAWPGATPESTPDPPPLLERARALARQYPTGTLTGRLALIPASGREQEARAAVAQVGVWLGEGLRRIALIAQDRLTARRVRALLERERVLVSDETGWLLSTSRAAASVDALIEVVASQAYYRNLLDLCKSPFIFADVGEDERKAAVFGLEASIRAASVKSGLARIRHALQKSEMADKSPGLALLDRVAAATARLRGGPAPLARWLERLHATLDAVGMLNALAGDAAGRAVLDLLAARGAELAGNASLFSFEAWRDWLGHEFEAASFRDGGIVSPIVVTPLNAVCLRRFEAALLLGGDARQLTPTGHTAFFNAAVRRELGLSTREDGERELKRDLELLLATVPRVVVTWQSLRDGEANLPAPELSLLSTLHQMAWGDKLQRCPPPMRAEAEADAPTAPSATPAPAPIAPPALIPRRVSVSAYASLVGCPYRFFARHVLGLAEMDEVSEDMDKGEYGERVHRVLERFHARHPLIAALPEAEALRALRECADSVFAPAIAENFLDTAWRLRWEKRLAAYLAWQRAREAEGWRWEKAETRVSRALPLEHGGSVELYGRIDRIDRRSTDAALYDYKTRPVKAIKNQLADDVQLPAYALMYGSDAVRAAYVALDDEEVTGVAAADDGQALNEAAARQGERLTALFDALYAGVPLPAHGVDSVCRWCEMRGLCRKEFA